MAGRKILDTARAHWIYIDFEELGQGGDPRAFLYRRLLDYLSADHPENPTDFESLVGPAYAEEFDRLRRGPLALLQEQPELVDQKLTEHLEREYAEVEPYVDRLLSHLAATTLCVVVLDNVDLYEDADLEAAVFSEGLALSKRVKSHVMVSVRDTTFVKHRSGSVFDAYELRRLWIDPPPFPAVLSARLTYSKKILEGRSAKIRMNNGMNLSVPDLSRFFDVV